MSDKRICGACEHFTDSRLDYGTCHRWRDRETSWRNRQGITPASFDDSLERWWRNGIDMEVPRAATADRCEFYSPKVAAE